MKPYTEVGCEAYILRDGKLLLGKRSIIKFGGETWGLPGGHMKFMERADTCIIRELKEELGLIIKPTDMRLLALTDGTDIPNITTHHIHITFKVNIGSQEPENREPKECDDLQWFPLDSLPDDIFPPHQKILESIRKGVVYKFKGDLDD